MLATRIEDQTGIAEARRAAATQSQALGFNEEDAGRVALVVTELATNILRHAQRGEVLIGVVEDDAGAGIECLALDKGPGIPDLVAARRDGHSTAGTAGNGLGAIHRNVHGIDIHTRPGAGTAILVRMRPGRPEANGAPPDGWYGVVCVPKAGEPVAGDHWASLRDGNGFRVMVADGLGHGSGAAEAAQAAAKVFLERSSDAPPRLLQRMHEALQATRGAAIAVATIDETTRRVGYAGVGNISAALVSPTASKQMVSHHGTIGHVAKRFQEFTYERAPGMLVVLCSDGIGSNWSLRAMPELHGHHPALIAGVIYRDFARGRDDATVLVARTRDA